MQRLKLFSGSSHPTLAESIAQYLDVELGQASSLTFSNDNRFITIDEPVRGCDVFVIQTGAPPVDSHIMEMLLMIRALRDSSAARITAVLPYYPYVRSDKRDQPRVCISARLVADLLVEAGANHVLAMDLHSPQIQGFFSVPCDHLRAGPTIIRYLQENWDLRDYVLVAGDAGAAKYINAYADALRLPIAIMDKRRDGNDERPIIKGIIGTDVRDKKVLIIDDEMASGGTVISNAKFLLEKNGAQSVDVCVAHAVLGGDAVERLNDSPIGRFVTTNTLPQDNKPLKHKEVVDISPLFGECIKRIHKGESIQKLNES